MKQCPSADILLADSSAYKKWCCHIWSQYHESFSRYHKKAVSTTIEILLHKQPAIRNGRKIFQILFRRNVIDM